MAKSSEMLVAGGEGGEEEGEDEDDEDDDNDGGLHELMHAAALKSRRYDRGRGGECE